MPERMGADITDEAVAGVIAGDMAVRGGGRVVAAGTGSGGRARLWRVSAGRRPWRWSQGWRLLYLPL